MKVETLEEIQSAVERARLEHPEFVLGRGYDGLVTLAAEEFGEMAQAVNDGKPGAFRAEMLDLIAVLVRFLEGDVDTGQVEEEKSDKARDSLFVDTPIRPELGAVLDEAKRIINGERQDQYGKPEDSFASIAELWSGYLHAVACAGRTCADLTPADVAHMMVLFKLARQMHGAGKRDNYVDAAGYIGIAADMVGVE